MQAESTSSNCCGCSNRTGATCALAFMLVSAVFLTIISLAGLSDEITDSEQTFLTLLLVASVIQGVMAIVGLIGTSSENRCLVLVPFVWVSISLLMSVVGMIVSLNPAMIVGIVLQTVLIWFPLFSYGKELRETQGELNNSLGANAKNSPMSPNTSSTKPVQTIVAEAKGDEEEV